MKTMKAALIIEGNERGYGKARLLKLWVATQKWVLEPLHVSRENVVLQTNITIMTTDQY